MPVAADRKLCSVSASIWLRLLIATSPEYHCQLVLVVKLTAVLNAPSGPILASPRGFIGNTAWSRSKA